MQQNIMITDVNESSSLKRWLVVLTSALLFFYSFLQMNMLNPIDSILMRDFSINATQLGNLSAMYFYGNFILLFPAGLLLDRFSPKKLLIIAMLMAVIFMFVFPATNNYWLAAFSRFMWGLSGAFGFLGAIRIASRWFPPSKMALASGAVVTLAMLGGAVAQTPMQIVSAAFGWRNAMLMGGILGIVIILVMFFVIQDYPKNYRAVTTVNKDISEIGFWRSIKMVILNRYNWLCGIYTSLMNLPIFLLGSLWGSMYLVQVNHFSELQAANIDAMLFFGTLIGSPLIGWISDRVKLRITPMIIGAIISLGIIFTVMYNINLSYLTILVLYLLLGLITSTQVLSYPAIAELNSPLVTGSAISVCSLLIMASGFTGQPLFGWLMDLKWQHIMVNGTPIYSLENFRMAMWMIPIGFIISLIISFFIKETHAKLQYKD